MGVIEVIFIVVVTVGCMMGLGALYIWAALWYGRQRNRSEA